MVERVRGVGGELEVVEESAIGGVEVGDEPLKAVGFDEEVVLGDGAVFDGDSVTFDNSADSDGGPGVALYTFSVSRTLLDYQHQIRGVSAFFFHDR